MATVTFDYSTWVIRFPELSGVSSALAQLYFNEAGLYCDNTDASEVTDVTIRAMLLNLVTAHIAKLNATINGIAPSDIVGHISNASEGSVSVGTDLNLLPGSAQWFAQTRYGFQYWQATSVFRRFRYTQGNPRVVDPFEINYGRRY